MFFCLLEKQCEIQVSEAHEFEKGFCKYLVGDTCPIGEIHSGQLVAAPLGIVVSLCFLRYRCRWVHPGFIPAGRQLAAKSNPQAQRCEAFSPTIRLG